MTPEEKQAAHDAIEAEAQADALVSRCRAMLYRAGTLYDKCSARGMAVHVTLIADQLTITETPDAR